MDAKRPSWAMLLIAAVLGGPPTAHAQQQTCETCATPVSAISATCDTCAAKPACDGCDGACESLTCDSCDGDKHLGSLLGIDPCCTWTADVGVMFLDRSNSDSVPIFFQQATGEVSYDTQDADYGWGAFPYARLTHMCCCQGWDIGYWGGDPWQSDDLVGDKHSVAFVGAGLVIGTTTAFGLGNISAGTQLHTADVNYRHVIGPNSTFLVGFRWLELADSLDISRVQNGVTEPFVHVDTNNHLYGLQLGLDTTLWRENRLSVVSTLRGAIMANHADQTSSSPFVSGVPGFVDRLTASDDDTAFFGGWGLQGQYQLFPRLSVVAGYQLFWLEQVALAPPQLLVNNFVAPGIADIDNTSGLFLHGALVGLSYQF